MTYHPLDDLPDDPPSLPDHCPSVVAYPGTRWEPAEVTVTCSCGGWGFESIESAGGPVESWGDAWDGHLTEVQGGEAA